jgi:L-iditol 2-dehydrogenase
VKIAELIRAGTLQLVEGPVEEPGAGQVQVRVAAVGICGSDLHSFGSGAIGGAECVYPQVLGHEPAGVVVKTGPGVTGWAGGDRAALEPAIYCYHCEFCQAGRHNICRNLRFQSAEGVPGFFREYVNLPAENLLPLPEGLGLVEATMFEPLAVVLHSINFAALRPEETAVVFGAGPIGLMTIALLKMSGAGRVWTVEPFAFRREMAKAAGADAAIDPHAVDAAREIWRETGQRGVDLAVDCAARERSFDQCVEATRNGGRMVITGIPEELRTPINWHIARRKELVIYNVRRSNHDSRAALQLLGEHRRRFGQMVTQVMPLEKVQAAFEMLRNQSEDAGKVVIGFGQGGDLWR